VSADVRHSLLSLGFSWGGWLHRKLEYRRFLSPKQMREKDNLPVWELQSTMMGTLAWKLPVESLIQPTTKGPT
jgi:hypothetical protein